ncbi:TEA domain-containing protein [Phanerochaete sordida]|uniref:TEA domain-containing protein n=1 Tax=Phanerochaete sordida TaxID=48140 RepID=A0A9P3LHP4_9APHY|nr:TEA domain-containing protein [Phanerochaete sordida]
MPKVSSSASSAKARTASPSGDELSDAAAPGTDAAVKSILNSRKCWRSLKGKEEPVWPPHLEAALIEGLEKYRPSESKSTRTLGRFPMRNKFVADHIFEKTAVRRTPKQVGSRIQQLRDTQTGKEILKVISDRHYEMMHPKRPSSSSSEKPHPSPAHRHCPSLGAGAQPSHVYVQALPASAAWHMQRLGACPPTDLYAPHPRPLRLVDPTVTFASPAQTPCQSIFTVFRDGQMVHQEVAMVAIRASPAAPGGAPSWLYTTSLAPAFWGHLCDSEEPASYTIHQEVVRMPLAHHTQQLPLLSVYYHFTNAASSTPPLSPRSSCGDSETDVTSALSRESSPQYPPRAPDDGDVKPYLGGALYADAAAPSLLYGLDEGYPASPAASPLDMPGMAAVDAWGYAPSTALHDMLAAAPCDPLFDPYIPLQ